MMSAMMKVSSLISPPRLMAAAFLIAGSSLVASAQSRTERLIDLRPKFEKGQEIRYEMRTETTTTYKAGEAGTIEFEGTSKIQQQLDLILKVIESDTEKGSTVELLVERVVARLETDGDAIDFDSAKPQTPSNADESDSRALEAFARMAGSSVLIEIEPSGRIASISAPSTLPGATSHTALTNAGLGGLLSVSGGIGIPFGQLLSMGHPTGMVKPRETWTNTDTLAGLGMTMTTTHRLKTSTSTGAKVSISGKIEQHNSQTHGPGTPERAPERAPERGRSKAPDQGDPVKGFIYEGEYDWDIQTGQLNKLDLRTQIKYDNAPLVYETRMMSGVRRVR
jgi:hypothetical protein